ncbi:MAG: 50S ribosomal protein L32 [Bacilli bacterium]|jgi:large subunit ribosomal protein L32|nr:50S ribosomal protein L32 [Bacilli bacterium]
MAVPFRRTSKTKKRMRRTHQKLKVEGLVACSNCGATIKSHNICPECGFYDGKKVLDTKKAAAKEEKPAEKPAKAKSK